MLSDRAHRRGGGIPEHVGGGGPEGRVGEPLPSRRTGSGRRVFDREDRDVYLGRPTPESVRADRAEALYCRVSGSTGRESSLAHQEKMLRESATGTVYRVYTDRGSGPRERLERD